MTDSVASPSTDSSFVPPKEPSEQPSCVCNKHRSCAHFFLLTLFVLCLLGVFCFGIFQLGTRLFHWAEDRMHSLQDSVQQQQQLIEKERLEINALRQEITQIHQTITEPNHQWRQKELAFMLRSAALQLHVYQDIPGTISLLETLDQLVQRSTNPSDIRLHQQLVKKLAVLKTILLPDVIALYSSLQTLGNQIEQLPIAIPSTSPPISENPLPVATPDSSYWIRLKTIFLTVAKHLFVVRKNTGATLLLLTPEERTLANFNVRAYIAQAELALLEKQPSVYNAALGQLEKIVITLFVPPMFDASSTIKIQQSIHSLQAVTLNPPLPSLDDLSITNTVPPSPPATATEVARS